MAVLIQAKTTEPLALPRSPLTRFWRREYNRPHARFQVTTRDGVTLRGVHLQTGHPTLVIYCHGFLSSKNYTVVPRFVELLAEKADALAFDFRGHGESDGATTLSEREVSDLDAVIEYARGFDYRRIYLVGSSMGGAVSIRYAAESPVIAGVATIGAFAYPDFTPMATQALKFLRLPVTHRVLWLARQARVESFAPRAQPLDAVARLSPRPLLLIHGEFDPLVPLSHARALYERAGEPKELIVIRHGSHDIPNLNARTRDWIIRWIAHFS